MTCQCPKCYRVNFSNAMGQSINNNVRDLEREDIVDYKQQQNTKQMKQSKSCCKGCKRYVAVHILFVLSIYIKLITVCCIAFESMDQSDDLLFSRTHFVGDHRNRCCGSRRFEEFETE